MYTTLSCFVLQKSNNYFTYAFVKVICLLYKNYIHLEFAFVFVLYILMVFRGSIHCTIQIWMIIRGSIHFELSSEGVFIALYIHVFGVWGECSLYCTHLDDLLQDICYVALWNPYFLLHLNTFIISSTVTSC